MAIVSRSFTTSDFQLLFANVLSKSLQKGFEDVEKTYDKWVETIVVPDFKPTSLVSLSPFSPLAKVPEGGEFTEGGLVEASESIQLETWGKIFDVSRQSIINDDINALTRVPAALGASARKSLNDQVYTLLVSNPTLADNTALFHTDHNNLGSDELSITGVDIGRKSLASQTYNDQKLNLRPDTLLVPVALEGTANVITSAQFIPGGSEPNKIMGLVNVVSDSMLDATSETAWYLFSKAHPAFVVATLSGHELPEVETKTKWTADAISYKIRWDYAVAAIEWRTAYKSTGV